MTIETRTSASWKRCGVCKRDLGFDGEFYECSVSTCTSGRSHPVFCSVPCWEQHVPVMRHRDAWAEQKRSPTRAQWEAAQAAGSVSVAGADAASRIPTAPGGIATAPRRIMVDARTPGRAVPDSNLAGEVLVVASKLKAYIKARSGMNTSESVLEELSAIIREHADRAIEQARLEGRRTVMDRDFRPS
ncbi:MAG: hypothetical protein ABR587_13995 [Candidatus Binatia bacterium]